MNVREESLRNQIAIGWIGMLLVVVLMLVSMTIAGVYDNDGFKALHQDPGTDGLQMLQFMLGSYALMPVVVSLLGMVPMRAVRWLAVVYAILIMFYFTLHHASHAVHGERPTTSSHMLDIAHHALALWVVINSIRWARIKPEQAA